MRRLGRGMLLAALCLPGMALPMKALAADPTRGIEVDVEEDGFSLEFPEPMLALDNQPVAGLRVEPAVALDCHWSNDTEVGCTVAGDTPLPPATRLTIRIAPGLQTAAGKPLGAVVLTAETQRPDLTGSVADWKAGVPTLVLEGNLPMTADAVARVVSLGDGERIWRGLRISPLPVRRDWDGRQRPRFAVPLPPDLPADAVVDVVADAGLRSSAGPLPSDEPGRLLQFRHAEPFRARAATCTSREREVRDLEPADGLSLDCVPGEPIAIHFSATLDADARAAFAAALPAGIALSRWATATAPVESGVRVSQGSGDVAYLVIDAADARVAFDIGSGLRDVDGRGLWAPTRVELRTGAPRPVLRAPATRWLLGDPERAGIDVINAPALTVDIEGLGAAPLRERVGIASTRGTAATAISASARRTLGEGGTLRWQVGTYAWQALRMAAPQFDLGAHVAANEVVAWALDWDDSRSLAGVQVELVRLAPAAKGEVATAPTETVVGTARTGRDGVARLVLPDGFARPPKTRGMPLASWFLRATHGARRAVLHLGEDGDGGLVRASDVEPRLFIATDRPLYRAGDTIRFHGWARVARGGRLLRPEDKAVELSLVSDAERTELLSWRGTLDDGGAFSGEFVLPSQTVDGDYCFRLDEGEHAACIFVGTFRAQDLWAQAATTTPLVRDGDRILLDIEAGYWSGGAASGAEIRRVRTTVEAASPADAYPDVADYAFLDTSEDAAHARLAPPAAVTATLDADGRARVEIPVAFVADEEIEEDDERDSASQPPAFARLETTAEVALAGREPTASNRAIAHYARHARYVGLRLLPAWFDAATPLRLDAVLVAADGTAVPGETINVTVTRRTEQVDGTTQDEPVATCTLVAGTPAPCDVPRTRSGRYVFTARSGEAAPAVLSRYVWNAADARGEAPKVEPALEVIAAPADAGAPVRLLLRQPYARADALLVVSAGGEVLATRTLEIDRAETELSLPTYADGRNRVDLTLRVRERVPAPVDADGVRAPPRSTALTVAVDVPRPQALPAVVVSLDRARAEPGQPVIVRVRNTATTPRSVALAVFDDALRSLAGARWDAFDPQGAAWLGHRGDDWRGRLGAIDFSDWNKARWTYALPWDDAKVDASLRGPAGIMAEMRRREAGAVRRAELASGDAVVNMRVFPRSPDADGDRFSGYTEGEGLDSITVTGSRILRADNEVPAPVFEIKPDTLAARGKDIGPIADLLQIVPDPGAARRDRASPPDPALLALRVRGAFADTALWQGGLRLAPGEERVFTVTAPDNLTRWRAVAWSADDGEGFHRVEATFDVGLPLEARLDAPVRLYPGDRAELTANLRQNGDAPLRVEARLAVEALGARAARTLDLAPRGQSSFALDIAPDVDATPRMLVATAHAQAGAQGDAVSQPIELASPRIEAQRVQAGWLGASPLLLMPTLPAGARDVRLSVTLLPGAGALVHGWIDDLHRYPHRCWEQMLSRAVAAAIALERGEGARFPDARASIDDALANVAVFQTGDGGFRYFADASGDDGGDVPLTAWTVRALRALAELGHDVPLRALSKADGYLQRRVHPSGSDPATRVRVAFAAAAQEKPGLSVTDGLWREFATLPLPAQVAAARAMAAGRHPQARDAARRLIDATTLRGEARVLRAADRHDRWMSSDLREQCELIALLRRHPSFADIATRRALIAGLGDLYAGGVPEVDTQSGAVCLLALRGLDRDGARTPVTLAVASGDRKTTLALAPGGEPPRWEIAIDPRDTGKALRLTPQVGGDAPASYRVEYRYGEDARAANASAIGFALQRDYRVLRDGRWQPVAGQPLRDGDWVRVTLRLDTTAERRFVAITDAVPGGLRPTDLALSGVAGVDLQAVSDEGSGWFRTRRLDPRAPKFYAEVLPAGRHEVHYFARVGNAGDYLAAPAQAELMYGAATRARTAATRVVIEGGTPGP